MIKYVNITMVFDIALFGSDVDREVMAIIRAGKTMEDVAIGELGISVSTLSNYMSGRVGVKTPYPSMTNFLLVCNCFGLNPSKYFHLET